MSKSIVPIVLALTVIATACATPPTRQTTGADRGAASTAPKRIVVAIMADPPIVAKILNPGSHWRGVEHLEALLDAGLTRGGGGDRHAELAEAVPTVENGLWKVNPDGTMEMRWTLKDGVQWQDGSPFTTADLIFTMQVGMDQDVPLFSTDPLFDHVASYEAPDARTMVVRWKDPYIEADTLFGAGDQDGGLPLPKHLLETTYNSDKQALPDDPYFNQAHIGAGPFKLKNWEQGSHLTMTAYDHYVLGRPKIDEIEVRFIEDASTLQANLLAGAVDMTLGRNLSGPQTLEVKQRWTDGDTYLDYSSASIIDTFVQLRDPDPAIMTDVTFRRAALTALDRQSMVEALAPGQSDVANSFIAPNQPQYRAIQDRYTVKYPYDPKKAVEMMRGIGYTMAADNTMRDGAGQPLGWQVRTTGGDDLREKIMLTSADNWKQVGMTVNTYVIPRQQASDREYRANFSAMEIVRQPADVRGLKNLHSRTTSLPENDYAGTGNRSRYFNPQLDDLIDKVFVTIPLDQRREMMGQIDHILTTDLPFFMIMYGGGTYLVNHRIKNFQSDGPWNAYQWELAS
ncbi:MAG TPA: ABC transporter substrate-binding protein [Chloroflexota bacterium]|nr:ABC transporter substrate-binding protein [Chloroflexota bacterium]